MNLPFGFNLLGVLKIIIYWYYWNFSTQKIYFVEHLSRRSRVWWGRGWGRKRNRSTEWQRRQEGCGGKKGEGRREGGEKWRQSESLEELTSREQNPGKCRSRDHSPRKDLEKWLLHSVDISGRSLAQLAREDSHEVTENQTSPQEQRSLRNKPELLLKSEGMRLLWGIHQRRQLGYGFQPIESLC